MIYFLSITSLYLVYYDIRYKKVPNIITLLLLIAVLIYKIYYRLPLKEGLISGLLAFVTFLIIYFISRGGIGMGDCKYTAVTSIYFGYSFWLNSILYTSIISLSVSLILLFVKKIKRETKIPFMPFLVSGWIGNYLKETIFYP